MGSGVHATGKYGFTGLFLKNTPINRFLTLQFSGNRLLTFFATSNMSREGAKGSRKPAVARPCDHVGELGLWGGFFGFFLVLPTILFFMGECVWIGHENIVNTIHHRTSNHRSHTCFKKIFPEIFLTL